MMEPPEIIRMNISRYREMLKLVLDDHKRAAIQKLLAQAKSALEDALSRGRE